MMAWITVLAVGSFDSAGPVQKDFYQRTANSIVACHEATGQLLASYDEEGRCAEESELSAWTLTSTLPLHTELTQFTSLDSRVATVGEYEGTVAFTDRDGRLCRFRMNVSYSGEDILVGTDAFSCL